MASTKVRALIKRRMQLADLGNWQDLIGELLTAISAAVASAEERKLRVSAATSAIHKYTAVCRKVHGKCLRSAAQILTGHGQPIASNDTFSSIAGLFSCTDSALPDAALLR